MRRRGWHLPPVIRVSRKARASKTNPQAIEARGRQRVLLPPSELALLSLAGSFAALIAIGTMTLLLPIASAGPGHADFVTALFTATSAVCVTGLIVVNSADYWSPVGQTAIVVMMFMGGLGIMTAGMVILVAVGRRITLNQRLLVRDTMGGATLGGAIKLGRYVILFALAAQFVGFVLLFIRLSFKFSAVDAAKHSFFHSVSAFNNAGFTIFKDSESLSRFQSDPTTLAIIGALIVVGAFSFPVIAELARRRRMSEWSVDTKLVLVGTFALWGAGVFTMLVFEMTNGSTLGGMSIIDKITNGAFQAVTARTAGFSTIDFSHTRGGTDFLFLFMMFIGGASGSVAGGIKVNTLMILVFAALGSLKGRDRTELFKRELPGPQVVRALALVILAMIIMGLLVTALAFVERHNLDARVFGFMDLLFEATSAFGTAGLSKGITPNLTDPGKIAITLAMFVGRLGPLTIALGLALRERRPVYRFAQEQVRIG